MSQLPLSGIKILDLAATREGTSCAHVLAQWGAERLNLPNGLKREHPEGLRILLLLVQEADILVARGEVDVAMLHEYNPMLIVCQVSEDDSPWAAASGILAALLQRERFGMGEHVKVEGAEGPVFTGFETAPLLAPDPEETLIRLGYAPEAIASLRRDGVF